MNHTHKRKHLSEKDGPKPEKKKQRSDKYEPLPKQMNLNPFLGLKEDTIETEEKSTNDNLISINEYMISRGLTTPTIIQEREKAEAIWQAREEQPKPKKQKRKTKDTLLSEFTASAAAKGYTLKPLIRSIANDFENTEENPRIRKLMAKLVVQNIVKHQLDTWLRGYKRYWKHYRHIMKQKGLDLSKWIWRNRGDIGIT